MPKEFIDNAQQIIPWMPLVTFIVGLITFALGHFMGHRSAIKRDKRKEFNDNAEPLLEFYEELLIALTNQGYYSTTRFPIEQLGKISRRLPYFKQNKFNTLVQEIIATKNPTTTQERDELITKVEEMCKIIRLR